MGEEEFHEQKEEDVYRLIVRENRSKANIMLKKGQMVTIDSYNDTRGIVAPDSHEEHAVPFDMGSQATIGISDIKLAVAKPYSRQ